MHPLPFILAATDQGAMILSHRDFCPTPDGVYGVGAQLLSTGSYDSVEIGTMIRLLQARRQTHGDGVVAVDCGANIGVHATCFARSMVGWGSVIAIEAQERVFYALAGNIALGNFFNARAIWAAVSDREGHTDIPTPDYLLAASLGSFELRQPLDGGDTGQDIDYAKPTLRVRVITVDSLRLERCDFLKVDCEGMEAEVLRGARKTIERCRPAIFAETLKGDAAATLAEIPADYAVHDMSNGVLAIP